MRNEHRGVAKWIFFGVLSNLLAVARNPLLVIAKTPFSYRILLSSAALVETMEKVLRRPTSDRIGVLDLVGIPSVRVLIPGRRTGLFEPRRCSASISTPASWLWDQTEARPVHPAWSTNLQEVETVRVLRRNKNYEAKVREIAGMEM